MPRGRRSQRGGGWRDDGDDHRGGSTLRATRLRVADWIALAGGAALVASIALHWVSSGPGSSLRGHDLVDAVVRLGRSVPGLSSARLTVLWYLVPALGALSWVTVGVWGAASRATRVVAIAATIAALLAVAAFARLTGLSDLGPGAFAAAAGAVTLLVASRV
jgi:hypothetical protein